MDVSRRDFIRLGTSAAVTTTVVAQAGGAQPAPVLLAQSGQPLPMGFDPAHPGLKLDLVIARPAWRSALPGGPPGLTRYVTLELGDRRGVSDRFS
jgi:hypothetical protein